MKFFISDLHFGSDDTIRFDNRPFKNSKEFINFSIKAWNKVAKADDVVYVIGGFVDCHSNEDKNCLIYLSIVKKNQSKGYFDIGQQREEALGFTFWLK